MKVSAAALAIFALVFTSVSCDKHSWKETQVLHEGMTGGHGGHGGEHHAEAAAEAKEAHGEVHTANPGEATHAPAPAVAPKAH
jgi:hypothetical protein